LGDVIIGLYIYIYVQDLMEVHKNITRKLRYTKKKHYRCIDMYLCMYRMRVPLRHTSVPILGLSLLYKTVKLLMANRDESSAIPGYIHSDTAGTEIVDPGKIP